MYSLHIANKNYSSWSLRPWVLMRERSIAFAEQMHRFRPGGAWSEFRAFSPTGKVPTLHDGAVSVWDSLAIVEYLAERHKGVWPDDERARSWARCAAAEMHSGFGTLREHCSFNLGVRVRLNEIPTALAKDIARVGELWNEGLERFGGEFLAGPAFSAVDAFYAPVVFRAQTYGLELAGPASRYMQRMLSLRSMREWYDDALQENFRDAEHDEAVRRFGIVVMDERVAAV